ncbi:MAG: alkaline phosphatase family protein [Acidobacteriota bacterium]
MSSPSVDALREQLRERGYLSHGIERWFALDPWSSRAFWLELATVSAKASALIALFAALPMVAVMLYRNHPLSPVETLLLTAIYGAASFVAAFAFIVVVALLIKLRPEVAIDTPRALLAISFAASAALTAPLMFWWYRFDSAPSLPELITGLALIVLLFLVATIVVSAALLSFSIYELQRIPAIHQKSRGAAMTMAAALLTALLFLPTHGWQEKNAVSAPLQIVTTPTTRKVALVAVDGLTWELFQSRPALAAQFSRTFSAARVAGDSTAERWSTVGTGVPMRFHGVRAIEGVRLAGGRHMLQTSSAADVVLRDIVTKLGLASRQPLPPTVRRRDYVWEIFARRGVTALAVNWWTSDDARSGGLTSISQPSIFSAAARAQRPGQGVEATALRVDDTAIRMLLDHLDREKPQFATVYLPALDVVLNRLPLEATTRVAASVRSLDALEAGLSTLRARGFDTLLIGLPGDRQRGAPLIAATFPCSSGSASAQDAAPTLAALEGFPPSREMSGRVLAGAELPRINSYGQRNSETGMGMVNDEYYRNLRSLGYVR